MSQEYRQFPSSPSTYITGQCQRMYAQALYNLPNAICPLPSAVCLQFLALCYYAPPTFSRQPSVLCPLSSSLKPLHSPPPHHFQLLNLCLLPSALKSQILRTTNHIHTYRAYLYLSIPIVNYGF